MPLADRLTYTCLRPHTRVPGLCLVLGSKVAHCSRASGWLVGHPGREDSHLLYMAFCPGAPGSEEAQDTEWGSLALLGCSSTL